MEQILHRLQLLETRSQREHEHLLRVVGGQRERFEKAVDEMKLAWLEQELALRHYAGYSREQGSQLRSALEELARTVDERLKALEQERPPAA